MKLILKEQATTEKKIFVLVGPPSVGKSTWINKTFGGTQNVYVISRDDLAEKVAKEYGWTYDDLFVPPAGDAKEGDNDPKYGEVVKSPAFMTWQPLSFTKILEANNKIHKLFTERVAAAQASNKPIVVDMTNMNAASRKSALKAIEGKEPEYEKIAVVFKFQGSEELIKKIAAKRAAEYKARGESKTIKPEVMDRMFKSYQQVTPEEGFDKVIDIDNIQQLTQVAGGIAEGKHIMKLVLKEKMACEGDGCTEEQVEEMLHEMDGETITEDGELVCEACLFEHLTCGCPDILGEAKYHGRTVKLGKPFLTPDGPKKRAVYVKNPKTGNIKKVNFGDKKLKIKKSNPKRRKSFRARHKCSQKKDRTTAGYWSCKAW